MLTDLVEFDTEFSGRSRSPEVSRGRAPKSVEVGHADTGRAVLGLVVTTTTRSVVCGARPTVAEDGEERHRALGWAGRMKKKHLRGMRPTVRPLDPSCGTEEPR